MFAVPCNIDKTDRINRLIIGLLICIAAFLGAGKLFFILLGLVLIIEGMFGGSVAKLIGDKKERNAGRV